MLEHQVYDSTSKDSCFSAARPCEDEDRAVHVLYGFALRRVETLELCRECTVHIKTVHTKTVIDFNLKVQ